MYSANVRDPIDSARRQALRTLLLASAGAMLSYRTNAFAAAPTMLFRTIGKSGERIPALGLGTWQAFDIGDDATARSEATATLHSFIDAGLRVIDTSPMYGSAERVVGELLEPIDTQRTAFIATKVWTSGVDAGRRQIENSFHLLRRTTLDLIQVHNLLDADAHLSTLGQLKQAGRVRYIGVTHYMAAAHPALVKYIESGKVDFVQVNYSLLEREAETSVLPAAAAHGVAVLINRPLAEGAILARTHERELPPWAAEIGITSWAQFALKYIFSHPAVTCVIPGTRNPHHLADNLAAASGIMPDAGMRAKMAGYFNGL